MDLLLLQTDIGWLDEAGNLSEADRMLGEAIAGQGPDLIVLPEMFATGFCMDAPRASEEGARIAGWMGATADRYDAAVAGTVAVKEGGKYYNRFLFVTPGGEATAYDKRHLFTFGGEPDAYKAGDKRVVVSWRGWRILLQTCYDIRFPVFSRSRGDYDMAVYCASWPDSRIAVWDTLLAARAIENASYVVGVNRVGTDPGNYYPGHSAVYDYKGRRAASLPEGEAGYLRHTVSIDDMMLFRKKFPVLKDADDFILP